MRDYDNSNRSGLLYEAVLPFIKAGDSVLDVGCGFAAHPKMQGTILPRLLHESRDIRYHGIDNRADVIAECRKAYPWAEFTVGDAALAFMRQYDAVLHLGFDRKDLSDAWKVHQNLIALNLLPRVVLLEAGSPLGKRSKHIESWVEVRSLYGAAGYVASAMGSYGWTYRVTQPARRYAVMEKR